MQEAEEEGKGGRREGNERIGDREEKKGWKGKAERGRGGGRRVMIN